MKVIEESLERSLRELNEEIHRKEAKLAIMVKAAGLRWWPNEQ